MRKYIRVRCVSFGFDFPFPSVFPCAGVSVKHIVKIVMQVVSFLARRPMRCRRSRGALLAWFGWFEDAHVRIAFLPRPFGLRECDLGDARCMSS